jgi:thiosulfate/3-mercaptopyruvate sulfurtransferase
MVDWGGHRVYSWEILQRLNKGEVGKDLVLVDVRSPREYTGEITAPPEYPMNMPRWVVTYQAP